MAAPLGLLSGTYLAEYGRYSRVAQIVRFVNDILLSAPSIIVGLFVYSVMVVPMSHFSGWAGAAALALVAVPVIVRTTEDVLRMVPSTLREAAFALGVPYWRSSSTSRGARRRTASSPASCWRWRGSAARLRRCCSPRSTTNSSPPT